MRKTNRWICGAVLAGAAALTASQSNAALVIDVRSSTGGKAVNVSAVNEIVNLNIYAVVTGADALNNEGMQSAYGSLISGTGDLQGTISAAAFAGNFGGTFQAGAAFDAGGDGDTDRGALDGGTTANYIYFRASSMQYGGTAITYNGAAGVEYLLGTATFTTTDLNAAGTTINWRPRLSSLGNSVGTAALWQQDGAGTSNPGTAAYNALTSPYRVGEAVVIAVPEPLSLSMVGLAAAGLLALRKRR